MNVAQIRALVVDDQPKMVESMRMRLGREIGWEVDWKTDRQPADEGQSTYGVLLSSLSTW